MVNLELLKKTFETERDAFEYKYKLWLDEEIHSEVYTKGLGNGKVKYIVEPVEYED